MDAKLIKILKELQRQEMELTPFRISDNAQTWDLDNLIEAVQGGDQDDRNYRLVWKNEDEFVICLINDDDTDSLPVYKSSHLIEA